MAFPVAFSSGGTFCNFQWHFRRGELSVKPSQGRALIKEPLGRFLEQQDYQLEPGGDYAFTIRAEL